MKKKLLRVFLVFPLLALMFAPVGINAADGDEYPVNVISIFPRGESPDVFCIEGQKLPIEIINFVEEHTGSSFLKIVGYSTADYYGEGDVTERNFDLNSDLVLDSDLAIDDIFDFKILYEYVIAGEKQITLTEGYDAYTASYYVDFSDYDEPAVGPMLMGVDTTPSLKNVVYSIGTNAYGITIDETGNLQIPKGLTAGTYKVRVNVSNENTGISYYESLSGSQEVAIQVNAIPVAPTTNITEPKQTVAPTTGDTTSVGLMASFMILAGLAIVITIRKQKV